MHDPSVGLVLFLIIPVCCTTRYLQPKHSLSPNIQWLPFTHTHRHHAPSTLVNVLDFLSGGQCRAWMIPTSTTWRTVSTIEPEPYGDVFPQLWSQCGGHPGNVLPGQNLFLSAGDPISVDDQGIEDDQVGSSGVREGPMNQM